MNLSRSRNERRVKLTATRDISDSDCDIMMIELKIYLTDVHVTKCIGPDK